MEAAGRARASSYELGGHRTAEHIAFIPMRPVLHLSGGVGFSIYMLGRVCRRAESADSARFLQTWSAKSESAD